jgi:hypothetical protein
LPTQDHIQKKQEPSNNVGNTQSRSGITLPAVPVVNQLKEKENKEDQTGSSLPASKIPVEPFKTPKQDYNTISHADTVQRFQPATTPLKHPAQDVPGNDRLGNEADTIGDNAIQLKKKKGQTAPTTTDDNEENNDDESQSTDAKKADQLETEYDEKETELKDLITEAETEHANLVTARQVIAARSEGTKAQDLVAELSAIVDEIETRKGEVEEEMNDESISSEKLDELADESGKFDTLFPKAKSGSYKLDNRVTEFQGKVELAQEAIDTAGVVAGALTALRALWATPSLAKGHFTKHAGDTGLSTETAYLTRAKELTAKSAGGDILKKTRGDGDDLFFDKSNGNFAIKSAAGKIRTLFNPGGGESYYNKQA